MLLTDQERERFAQWCRRYADSTQEIIDQLEKMPTMSGVVKQEKIKHLACSVVYTLLTNTESQTLGGGK